MILPVILDYFSNHILLSFLTKSLVFVLIASIPKFKSPYIENCAEYFLPNFKTNLLYVVSGDSSRRREQDVHRH